MRSQNWRGVGKPAQLRAIVRVSYDRLLFSFGRWCNGVETGSQVPPALTLRCSFERVNRGGSSCKVKFMRGVLQVSGSGQLQLFVGLGRLPFAIWVM